MTIPCALLPVFHPFPSEPMKTRLTNLIQAIAFLAVASLVIGSLAYCFAQLLIGGAL